MDAATHRQHGASHRLALATTALLALAFGVLVIGGADAAAVLPPLLGVVPAAFPLVTDRRPSVGELILWWTTAAVTALVATVLTTSAVAEGRSMRNQTSCALKPLEFENDSVATLRVEWWPPQVQCRYGYSYQQTEEVAWVSRWWIYWPAGFVPLAGLLVAGATRQTWRLGRPPIHLARPAGD